MGGSSTDKADLSAGEAKLYDRQLRLWGVEAQQKLRATNVLIAGLNSVGAEVCKNVVLTGVNSVTLLDHRNLGKTDFPGQFMATFDSVGENRAEASVARLSSLNPNVKVTAIPEQLSDKTEDFFDQFNVVCVVGYPFDVAEKVDTICRSKKISFLVADCFGAFGYMFSDLGESFKCHSETENKEKDGTVTKTVNQHEVSFKSMADSIPFGKFDVDLSKQQKMSKVLLLSLLKDKLISENQFMADFEVQIDQFLELGAKLQIEPEALPLTYLADAAFNTQKGNAEVAAVLGGVIGQEVIKIASRNDLPFNNFFSYNAVDCVASVVSL